MSEVPTLDELWAGFSELRECARNLIKYKGNRYYKVKYDAVLKDLNRKVSYLREAVSKTGKKPLIGRFEIVFNDMKYLLSDYPLQDKVNKIGKLELFWPSLEVQFKEVGFQKRNFEIPIEIPMADYRLDLEEAVKDYDNGCYLSALVMCRRSYEHALVSLYKSRLGREPVEDQKCPKCGETIRPNAYMGIAKLHTWAIKEKIITERLKQVGFLLTDMGAGAAHPPLTPFPRDKELSALGIATTIALLKEIAIAR